MLEARYVGKVPIETDEGVGRPSQGNMLRALRVLAWYSARAAAAAGRRDRPRLSPDGSAVLIRTNRQLHFGRFRSSRLLAAPDMADALVGRVEMLELWPFSQGELAGTPEQFVDRLFDAPRELVRRGDLDRRHLIDRVLAGGFPEAIKRAPSRRRTWFDS